MKRILFLIALLAPVQAFGQFQLAPVAHQQFFTNTGLIAAGYKLCTFLAGSTTPQAAFSDNIGTALPNPITLNAAGRPQTGGGTETGLYLNTATYKFILYASGTGNTCNGTAVGALIWSQDNIAVFADLTTAPIIDCSSQAGTSASAKIAACVAALGSTGGTADARRITGAQTWNSDAFAGITAPIDFLCGAATFTVSVTSTFVTSVNFWPNPQGGCIFKPNSGITLHPDGPIRATETSQIFDLTGGGIVTPDAGGLTVTWYPHWFGAVNDNDSVDSTKAIQAAINAARNVARGPSYATNTKASRVTLPSGYYAVSSLDATNAAGLEITGLGKAGRVVLYADKQASATTVLDLTSSNNIHITGITIAATTPAGAQPSVTPTTGMLLAASTTNSCNANYIEASGVSGFFSKAALYVYACTDNRFMASAFSSSLNTVGAVVLTATNTSSVTSAFVTIQNGTQPTGENDFFGTEFHSNTVVGNTSPAIFADGIYATRFYGGVIDNNGAGAPGAVSMSGTNHTISFFGTQFFSSSGTSGPYAFTTTGTNTDFTSIGCDFGKSNGYVTGITNGTFTRPNISGNFGVVATDQFNRAGPLTYGAYQGTSTTIGAIGNFGLDQTQTGNYALSQDNVGNTNINAATGKFVTVTINSAAASTFLNNGGNGSLIVNGNSTDFSSGILVSEGTAAIVTATSNAIVLALNASGGDGNSQIVATHSGAGTTKPLEIFSDSTKDITFGAGSITIPSSATVQFNLGGNRLLSGTPTINSCGNGSITSGSTDFAGEATNGNAVTSCAINFSNATGFSAKPFCVATTENGSTNLTHVQTSQSGFTVSNIANSDVFFWVCVGR